MARRTGILAVALLALVAPLLWVGAASAQTPGSSATLPPTPLPKAWMLVDADTGAVLGGTDIHTPMPPASTIKLLTGLLVAQRLPANEPIPITTLDESKPARKINVKAGQVWDREDLLYSMLLVSANDAAYALAEEVGNGSLDAEIGIANATLSRLGARDNPAPNDPAGLDDETFSNRGGSRISAWDLAIVARAVLREPELTQTIQTLHYEFEGGDGLHHELNNHDSFLGMYAGATGLKTGGTDLAGRTFVGTASRDGRTMLVVEFAAANIYASAAQLLDQGFATPVAAEANLEHLPAVVAGAARDPGPEALGAAQSHAASDSGGAAAAATAAGAADEDSGGWLLDSRGAGVVLVAASAVGLLIVFRRRVVVRRRELRRSMRAHPMRARRPRPAPSAHVPHHAHLGAGVEEQLRGVLLLDVSDEPHVDAVADELL
jgi:D-alanyl-D-alanine carboxypeptidase (penicillin-binding protein 5/6)